MRKKQSSNSSRPAGKPAASRTLPRDARWQAGQQRPTRRPGILFFGACLFLFAAFLIYQLYQIQIIDHVVNAEKAAAQHFKRVTEEPRRGHIFDRNGVELAGTTYVHRIGITPKDVYSITKNVAKEQISEQIATILELPLQDVQNALAQTDESYIQLKKDVPRDQTELLRTYLLEHVIGGVRIDTEARRYYTNGSLGSEIIGFCRYDDGLLVGQLGVELQYNRLLTGQPGYMYVETDNYRSKGALPFSVPTSLRARHGQNLAVTLDINIQKIVQEELAKAVALYDVREGGEVIVMDPYTGDILAMASYPFFSSSDPTACPPGMDPDEWQGSDTASIEYLSANVWRNRAISDSYEPGSTMKALTLSMVLEEALAHEKSDVVCKPLTLYNWTINCVRRGGHGEENLELAFWRSCNPVFAQLSLNLGLDRFYSYIRSFGLMDKTGIDLPAESTGILHSTPTDIDMATLSFGESSTVTPLQMATSFCVFANGGKLVRPGVIRSVTDTDGAMVSERRPETLRQVISESTATRVREQLKGVVLYGTGSPAYVEGYSVAGKTSTSTDDDGDHTLSFAGIAPAENPQIVVLVVLDKPEDRNLTSKVAAKTCGRIIERTLAYQGVERVLSDSDVSRLTALTKVPDVRGLTLSEALRLLNEQGFRGESAALTMGDATLVKQQWPEPGTPLHNRSLVALYPVETPDMEQVAIPDFRGRTVQEAMTLAAESGLNILIDGSCLGIVASQDPLPVQLTESNEPGTAEAEPTGGAPDDDNLTDVGTDQDKTSDDNTDEVVEKLYRGDCVEVTFIEIEEELAQNGDAE